MPKGIVGFFRKQALLLCLVFSVQAPPCLGWMETESTVAVEDEISTTSQAVDTVLHPFDLPDDADHWIKPGPGQDDCDWELEEKQLQDQSQEVLRSWTCHTFRWFDSWWGQRHDFPENEVSGMILLGAEYNQYEGFDPRMRLRVRAPLPNFSSRWDLMFGRVDEEAFVSDAQSRDLFNPALTNRAEEDAWILGLGHRKARRRSGWDWSIGLRLRLPPVPYLKTQYYYHKRYGEATDLRFRQTLFWRSDDGFGTTSRAFVTHGLDPKNVLRWEGILTISEVTEGTKWYLGHTWYHLFSGYNAFSLLSFARGETGAEVGLHDIGFKFVWRRPWTRDWMFLSMGPTITWPRELASEERELSLGFGMWIEMQFGNWRYQ